MGFIACSFLILDGNHRYSIKGQYSRARLVICVKEVLDCVEFTESCLRGIMTVNASLCKLLT
jgi:hypothetical protein